MTDQIAELEVGESFNGPLLLQSAEIRETKSGKPYLAGQARDRSGAIDIRFWDYRSDAPPADPGELIQIKANVDAYQGELQLDVDRIVSNASAFPELEPSDFVDAADDSIQTIMGHVTGLIDQHCEEPLHGLLYHVARQLRDTPAAQTRHHARYHGLLEHVRSMAQLADRILEHYDHRYESTPRLDLVLAGCVLHDAGKVYELSGPVATTYTTDGHLEGHISLGLDLLDDAFEATGTDPLEHADLRRHLRHLILSHHGKKGWGSPVEPRTPEAKLLHQLDMMDSRLDPVCSALEQADEDDERVRSSNGEELILAGGGSDE